MRAGLSLLLAVALLAGCGEGAGRPELTDESMPSTTADVEAMLDEGEVELGDAVSVTRDDTKALVTPSGIVVPVTGIDEVGYSITTPCGNEGYLAGGTPLLGADVVLDPGHGGEIETGAVGANGLMEKDLNLTVAQAVATELDRRGWTVVLTRTGDYRVPLAVRAEIGNRLEARAMVSIHHNAPNWLPSETPGTEVFVQDGNDESRRLGGLIQEEVVDALSAFGDIAWTTNDDAGALVVLNDAGENSYGMIRRPLMPAVLAELGYLSNPPEAELFTTDAYVVSVSIALADAIERWLSTDDPGSGFVDEPRIFNPSGATGGSEGCEDPDLGG